MKATLKTITDNPTYAFIKTLLYGYLGYALYTSFAHITQLFARWGASTPASAPILIDSLMVLGRLIRSPKLTKTANRWGIALQIFGGVASLAANILAGQTFGDRAIGVIVITGLLVVEIIAEKVRPVQVDTTAAKAAAKAAATAKGQATRAANKAKKDADAARRAELAADRRERQRLARELAAADTTALTEWAADPAAPVSPAPIDYPGYL